MLVLVYFLLQHWNLFLSRVKAEALAYFTIYETISSHEFTVLLTAASSMGEILICSLCTPVDDLEPPIKLTCLFCLCQYSPLMDWDLFRGPESAGICSSRHTRPWIEVKQIWKINEWTLGNIFPENPDFLWGVLTITALMHHICLASKYIYWWTGIN